MSRLTPFPSPHQVGFDLRMMGAMKLQGPCQQALQVEARQRLDQAGSAIERGGWLTIKQWCFKDLFSVFFA